MFHQFPVEIQYMIYNLVFIHVDAIKTCRARQTSLQNEVLLLPLSTSISRRELSLLAINRYVRSVTLPFFWRENAFCFDASSHSDIRVFGHKIFHVVARFGWSASPLCSGAKRPQHRSLTLFLRLLTFCPDPAQLLSATFFHSFL